MHNDMLNHFNESIHVIDLGANGVSSKRTFTHFTAIARGVNEVSSRCNILRCTSYKSEETINIMHDIYQPS